MSKIAIVTDSTAYLPEEIRKNFDITMVPLSVNFGDETFQEEVEITTEQFYEKMKQAEHLPSTSQPSVGSFEQEFERLSSEGYEEIISIHISSGVSGTFQSAQIAADMVREKVKVHCYDTEISCMAQGYYVIEAAEMAKQGKDADAILERLNEIKESMRAYFIVDDLKHLHRGGRLNGAQLVVGSLLQIKPILHLENKVIVPFEKVRTSKKALSRILGMLAEDASKAEQLKVVVIHGNIPEEAEKVASKIREEHSNADVDISYLGPVVGTHLGEGTLAIGWYKVS
ncbi:DegV family protein [Anaerobacillus sp. MEB173]|uniref:DegV family protein n=1 Tax=Anaerobacillus sp. MEB173 TaxID=3383345 RepID=UPI003F937A9F